MGRKTQNGLRRRKGKDKKREKFDKTGKYNSKAIRIQFALKEKDKQKRKQSVTNNITKVYKRNPKKTTNGKLSRS